jgi:hypothetical protein
VSASFPPSLPWLLQNLKHRENSQILKQTSHNCDREGYVVYGCLKEVPDTFVHRVRNSMIRVPNTSTGEEPATNSKVVGTYVFIQNRRAKQVPVTCMETAPDEASRVAKSMGLFGGFVVSLSGATVYCFVRSLCHRRKVRSLILGTRLRLLVLGQIVKYDLCGKNVCKMLIFSCAIVMRMF